MEFLKPENVKKYGEGYIAELTKELRSRKKDASGRLIKSLSDELKTTAEGIDIIINGEEYLEFIDSGRKPGSFPPLNAIKQWARLKGISQAAVFPIAKKIFKFGIKPTKVLEATERRFFGYGYTDELERDIVANSEEEIVKGLNKLSFEA